MLFNSIDFAIFLPIVFFLFWFVAYRNIKLQNILLVVASYVFYGWWDWRFLFLIFFSTAVDFTVGLRLAREENQNKRKLLLCTSLLVNLGFLGFFKYHNFFINNFIDAFSFLGIKIHANSLNIILPVGISFYTFQTLSYTIDVYKKKLKPTTDVIAFFAFVSFFPQLVAGPIERATHLLPQFYKKREFDYSKAVDGLRQILWGLFKKILIADKCAVFANSIFNNSSNYSGGTLVLGAIFFAFQIYGDFSGYSDIAIGTSRLFGIDIMRNFSYPYFSRDIAEFWRRWHISLSSWFRDYLYIPIGGSRGSTWMKVRNIFIIFLVSGFWHGANWTYIVWGGINAIYYIPLLLIGHNRNNLDIVARGKKLPNLKEGLAILMTFGLTVFAWIFFRAQSVGHAIQYISGIFTHPETFVYLKTYYQYKSVIFLLGVFIVIEWLGREGTYAISTMFVHHPRFYRWTFYLVLCLMIVVMQGKQQEFIYFQF